MKRINILAVNDPAVQAYVDPNIDIIGEIRDNLRCDVEIDIVDFVDYYDRLMSAFETDYYDIVMVAGHLWLGSFIKNDYLSPIHIHNSPSYEFEDVLASIRKEMFYGENQYLLPSFCDGHMVLYRKSDFQEALNPVTTPMEIYTSLKNTFVPEDKPFVLKAHPSEVFLDMLPYFRAYDVEPFDAHGQALFNTEVGIKAVKVYKDMMAYCPKETLSYGNEEVKVALMQKQCKAGVTWGGQLGALMGDGCIEAEDIGFSMLKKPWNVTWSFGLNSKSKNPSLSVQVMQILTMKEMDKAVGRICGNPTRQSNFNEDKNNYPWYSPVQQMIESYEPLASFPNLPEAIGILSQRLTAILADEMTIEAGLKEAEENIRGLL